MKRGAFGVLLIVLGSVLLDAQAAAQCDQWRPRSGLRIGGQVYASVTWDPDGHGPLAPVLVVGGSFERAGGADGTLASNIATWNGTDWQALGAGLNGPVHALGVYNGQLIAGGHFLFSVPGNPTTNIARWNGASWQPLGPASGMTTSGSGAAATVYALAVSGTELIAGGHFNAAGGVGAGNIARWNGSTWQPLNGCGGSCQGVSGDVFALAVHLGMLHAGGVFEQAGGVPARCVARWRAVDSTWEALGSGVGTHHNGVYALAVYNGALYAGGGFANSGGGTALDGIAQWNGSSWIPLAGGVEADEGFTSVSSLQVFNGELVAGGNFDRAGAVAVGNIASWDGVAWHRLGSGTNDFVGDLSTFGGQLIVGGAFNLAGPFTVNAIASWDGAAWVHMTGVVRPPSGSVMALTPWAGHVVLGGDFVAGDIHEPRTLWNLAAWNGVGTVGIGTPDQRVRGVATAPGTGLSRDLIIGGDFTSIDGVSANRIARINDTLAAGWEAIGPGFNAPVHAITYWSGSVYAAGEFTVSGSTIVHRIARWNGSAWVPLLSGLNGTVHALKGYNGFLYVGGSFTSAGGLSSGPLARWNGSSWSIVGGTFAGPSVQALEVYNNELIIGGLFPGINSSPNLARWNGSTYSTFGTGGTDAEVQALTVSDNTLIIGGAFTSAGGVATDHVARWNGSAWNAIRGGANDQVRALTAFRNEFHVGGDFTAVRFGNTPAERYARFSEDGVPWIAYQPEPQTAGCGQRAIFRFRKAQGYGMNAWTWRRNGVPLVNGPTGTGSTIEIHEPNLHILNVGVADEGAYDCVISNICGSATTESATLVVSADFNADGAINSQDFFDFLTAFFASQPGADFNDDGVVNSQDFFDFLASFFAGC